MLNKFLEKAEHLTTNFTEAGSTLSKLKLGLSVGALALINTACSVTPDSAMANQAPLAEIAGTQINNQMLNDAIGMPIDITISHLSKGYIDGLKLARFKEIVSYNPEMQPLVEQGIVTPEQYYEDYPFLFNQDFAAEAKKVFKLGPGVSRTFTSGGKPTSCSLFLNTSEINIGPQAFLAETAGLDDPTMIEAHISPDLPLAHVLLHEAKHCSQDKSISKHTNEADAEHFSYQELQKMGVPEQEINHIKSARDIYAFTHFQFSHAIGVSLDNLKEGSIPLTEANREDWLNANLLVYANALSMEGSTTTKDDIVQAGTSRNTLKSYLAGAYELRDGDYSDKFHKLPELTQKFIANFIKAGEDLTPSVAKDAKLMADLAPENPKVLKKLNSTLSSAL